MIAALLLAATDIRPSAPAASASAAIRKAGEALQKGRYLEANDRLLAAAIDDRGREKDEFAFQLWEQLSPFVSGEPDPVVEWRAGRTPRLPGDAQAAVLAARPVDALGEISKRARNTRIVILNEAHNAPRSRVFALEVARALRPLGYTYLAAEGFANEPAGEKPTPAVATLAKEGFVRHATGYYTQDPVFAAFVREALAIGYRPIAYEQTAKQSGGIGRASIPVREEAQTSNLLAALARLPADAKVMIYVGYSHVAEAPIGGGAPGTTIEWMAARLKRATGIDPLTIDQTALMGIALPSMASYPFGERSAVLVADGRPAVFGQYKGAVDLQVVHPPARHVNGRPTWLSLMGGRPTPVPAALLPARGRRLVQAFAADAPADAVPLDQVVVRAGVAAPMLMLPPGPVRYATEDAVPLP